MHSSAFIGSCLLTRHVWPSNFSHFSQVRLILIYLINTIAAIHGFLSFVHCTFQPLEAYVYELTYHSHVSFLEDLVDTKMVEMEETILMGEEDLDFYRQLELEEEILMGAEDLNVQLRSEVEGSPEQAPGEDPQGEDPGEGPPEEFPAEEGPDEVPQEEVPAEDGVDPNLCSYADRTLKTGWQNRCALMIALCQMERFEELERVINLFSQHENIWRQLLYLKCAIQRFGDRGPRMLGYKR